MKQSIDYSTVIRQLEKLRKESKDYLDNAIETCLR